MNSREAFAVLVKSRYSCSHIISPFPTISNPASVSKVSKYEWMPNFTLDLSFSCWSLSTLHILYIFSPSPVQQPWGMLTHGARVNAQSGTCGPRAWCRRPLTPSRDIGQHQSDSQTRLLRWSMGWGGRGAWGRTSRPTRMAKWNPRADRLQHPDVSKVANLQFVDVANPIGPVRFSHTA